ncbi:ATP phosphoribosyltransferase [Chitinophaga nivalis]|uniref:ATP phosphoribosyltransferase n=1 Tax=Chitinophaga nivalis TaxID=2991709 RepID=A0ABT3IT36_9BACT|nr:ATP phosphoribosyltransferase [Chitinophaga nivalis]MCW3463446.1 ATP phosphoribosyltransferase [Chitinophaga nivalis]MCW3486864.1 ATP phosphoribosyltransferase [Chitinophaga nivalis]
MYEDHNHISHKTVKPLTIAIGKGRGFYESLDYIHTDETPGYQSFLKGEVPVYQDESGQLTLMAVRSRDMPWLLQQGHIDVAIGSSVWFSEYQADALSCAWKLPLQECRLSLIASPDMHLPDIKNICTKFENITRRYITALPLTAEILLMEGSHEAALFLKITDAIVDVIETGRTIRRMGFRELDTIAWLSHEMWLRTHDTVTRERLAYYLKKTAPING